MLLVSVLNIYNVDAAHNVSTATDVIKSSAAGGRLCSLRSVVELQELQLYICSTRFNACA